MQRLDVGTSGVMVIAKSEHAYSVLKNAFRHRTVDKTYHALVQGHPDPLAGTVDAPIGRHPHHDYKFAVMADGRHSITHYETLEAHRFASLLEVHLETGRTHQIRVHMSALQASVRGRPHLRRRPDPRQAARARAPVAARHAARLRAPRDAATTSPTSPPTPTTSRTRSRPSGTNTDVTSADLALRPATPADLPALAEVHLAARRAAGTAFPPSVHDDDEARAWVAGWDLAAYDVWLASVGDQVAGYARSTPTWLDDLYVHPDHQGTGVGSALFETVASRHPHGFCLWVFESNEPARAFYRRHGCLELERTDGSANEERAPDIRVAWPGPDPLAFLRGLIDDTDLVLGDVLARRTALTRAVQAVKPSGERDPRREAEIARRVASVVPELGEERVARIVDVIIRESLDAAG